MISGLCWWVGFSEFGMQSAHTLKITFCTWAFLQPSRQKMLNPCFIVSQNHSFFEEFKQKLYSFLIQTQHLRYPTWTRLFMPTIPPPQTPGKPEQGDLEGPFWPRPAGILWNNWAEQLYFEITDYLPFLCCFLLLVSVVLRPDKWNANVPKSVSGNSVRNLRCAVGTRHKCSPVPYI